MKGYQKVQPYERKIERSLMYYSTAFCKALDLVNKEKLEGYVFDLQQDANNHDMAIYFHIPFCMTNCLFCMWDSKICKEGSKEMEEYLKNLKKEALFYANTIKVKTSKIKAVYIGGGSPTILSSQQLDDLLYFIEENFNLNNVEEFTVEGAVRTITDEKLSIFKKHKVTRTSFGVQTFNERIRKIQALPVKSLVIEAISKVENAGFTRNIDLMIGLPEQNMEIVKQDLEESINLNVTGIDAYIYCNAPTTKNYKFMRNKLYFPNSEEKIDMFNYLQHFLRDNGYIQNVIQQFYKKGVPSSRSLYNTLNRDGTSSIIGMGMGVLGSVGRKFYINDSSLEEYNKWGKSDSQGLPIEIIRELTEEEDDERKMVLFAQSLCLKKNNVSHNCLSKYKQILDSLIERRLIVDQGDCFYMTDLGKDWFQNIGNEFISQESNIRLMAMFFEWEFPEFDLNI